MYPQLCVALFGFCLCIVACGPEDMRKNLPTATPSDTATNYVSNVTELYSFENGAIDSIEANFTTYKSYDELRLYTGDVRVVLFGGSNTLTCDSLTLSFDVDDPYAIVSGEFTLYSDSTVLRGSSMCVDNWLAWENYKITGLFTEVKY